MCTTRFDIQKPCILSTEYVCNGKLVCLLRGTNWLLKYNSGFSYRLEL
jgi:hypothetical protein